MKRSSKNRTLAHCGQRFCGVLMLVLFVALPWAGVAQSVDSLLARYRAAMGPLESVRSIYTEQNVEVLGIDVPITTYRERGRVYYMKRKVPMVGWTVMYACDTAGWTAQGEEGMMEVKRLPRSTVDSLIESTRHYGELVGEGERAWAAGKKKYNGEQCWVLVAQGADGTKREMYLSQATGLLVGMKMDGAKISMRDYRRVKGVQFAYEVRIRQSLVTAKRRITKLQVNEAVDTRQFAVPN